MMLFSFFSVLFSPPSPFSSVMRNTSSLGIVLKSSRAERVRCQEPPHIRCNWCVLLSVWICVCIYILYVYETRYDAIWSTCLCQGWCQSLEGKLTSLFPNPHGLCQLGGLASANERSLLSRTGRSTREEKGSGEKKDKKSWDRGILASHLGTDFNVATFSHFAHSHEKRNQCWKKKDWEKSIETPSDGPPETSITVCRRLSESAAERGRGKRRWTAQSGE